MSEALIEPKLSSIACIGADLRAAMNELLDAIQDVERRPTALARVLGVNRVIVSRLLNALKHPDALEVLQHLPGPESLRSIVQGASIIDVISQDLIGNAIEHIDRFDRLIRDCFGTRSALNAAISDESDCLRRRYEESARFKVYDGMRHVLGVEAEVWLTSMIFSPRRDDEKFLSITTVDGALRMRRLRADTPVRFTFGPPHSTLDNDADPHVSPIALQEFYANEPAPLQTEVHGGQLVHRLKTGCGLGKDAIVDMLAVSHAAQGPPRFATSDRPIGGAAIFPDVPVKMLLCDAIVHEDVFPSAHPRLIIYNVGSRGPADPNDRDREIDRLDIHEAVDALPGEPVSIRTNEVPHYAQILERIFDKIREPQHAYRVFRVRVAYPLYGFQYVIAFDKPHRA